MCHCVPSWRVAVLYRRGHGALLFQLSDRKTGENAYGEWDGETLCYFGCHLGSCLCNNNAL